MGIIKQNIFFRALTFQRTGLSCSTSRDMSTSQLWLFTTVFSFWITNYSKLNFETTVNCTNAIMLWEPFDSVQSSCSLAKHDDPDHTMMTNTLKRTPCSSHQPRTLWGELRCADPPPAPHLPNLSFTWWRLWIQLARSAIVADIKASI